MSPWVGMFFISLLTGLMMLFVFKWTSNQEGIRRIKDRIKAHLLEIRLYKDSFSQSLQAQGNILRCNLRYIGYAAKPMLVMILPLILILIQLNFWFGYDSLTPHEKTLLKIKLKDQHNPMETPITVQPSSGLVIDAPPVRIQESNEINWRFFARSEGVHFFTITINKDNIKKSVLVAQKPFTKISPVKTNKNFLQQVLYPSESPIEGLTPVKAVEIQYPTKGLNLFGWHIHWLIVFFVLSILSGFAFKGVFKVQI